MLRGIAAVELSPHCNESCIAVWGLGFGVWGLGFGVWGLGFGVWGFERAAFGDGFSPGDGEDFNVSVRGLSLGFGVWGLGFGVWGLGFGVGGWGLRVSSTLNLGPRRIACAKITQVCDV